MYVLSHFCVPLRLEFISNCKGEISWFQSQFMCQELLVLKKAWAENWSSKTQEKKYAPKWNNVVGQQPNSVFNFSKYKDQTKKKNGMSCLITTERHNIEIYILYLYTYECKILLRHTECILNQAHFSRVQTQKSGIKKEKCNITDIAKCNSIKWNQLFVKFSSWFFALSVLLFTPVYHSRASACQ